MKILVTGAAGFIGSKLADCLAQRGDEVIGLDNINDYYDVRLKLGRLEQCGIHSICHGHVHVLSLCHKYPVIAPVLSLSHFDLHCCQAHLPL